MNETQVQQIIDNDLLRRHLTKEQYTGLKNLAESNSNATIRFNISVDTDSVDNEFDRQIKSLAFSEKLTSVIAPNDPNQKSKLDIDQLVNKVIVFLAGGASLGAAIAYPRGEDKYLRDGIFDVFGKVVEFIR